MRQAEELCLLHLHSRFSGVSALFQRGRRLAPFIRRTYYLSTDFCSTQTKSDFKNQFKQFGSNTHSCYVQSHFKICATSISVVEVGNCWLPEVIGQKNDKKKDRRYLSFPLTFSANETLLEMSHHLEFFLYWSRLGVRFHF